MAGVIEFFQNLLPGKTNAPTAPGNTSNTTIAAATTETTETKTQTPASSSTPQVAPAGSRKQKQFERDYERTQGGQTSTPTTSTPAPSSSPSSNPLQNLANQNKPTQTVTEAMRGTTPSSTPEPEKTATEEIQREQQEVSNLEMRTTANIDPRIRYQIELSQNSTPTPGLRELAEAKQAEETRENLVIGNVYTTAETLLKNPDGSLNLRDNLFEQFEEWDAYDGSGDYRKQKAISAAVEIPSYFVGGFGVGAAGKVAQTAINKVGATAIGGKIVNVATSPIIKPASIVNPATHPKVAAVIEGVTTPTAAAVNVGTGLYAADVAVRIAEQPTVDKKIEYALNVALKEIPFGAAGAVRGYQAVDKAGDVLATVGKTEIPFDKIAVKGIPLGDYTPASLKVSFEENKLIPAPYKIARTDNPYYPRTSASLNPDKTDFLEAWHATGSGQYFGKRLTVGAGSSEVSGLYVAPKVVSYFLGDSAYTRPRPALFVSEFGRSPQMKAVNLRVSPDVKYLDWDKAVKDSPYSAAEVYNSKELTKEVGDAYINKVAEFGDITAPLMKNEYEAVIKPGSEFIRLRRRYYTRYNDRVVSIDEYKPINAPARERPAGNSSRISNGSTTGKNSRNQSRRNPERTANYPAVSGSRFSSPSSVSPSGRITISRITSPLSDSSERPAPSSSPVYSPPVYSSPVVSNPGSSTASGKSSGGSSLGRYTPPKISPVSYSPYRMAREEIKPLDRKKDDDLKKELKQYRAARTGRIDHLSIVDPAEMLGRGSLTDRSRPDRVFNRELLYIVDGGITTKKPRGRVRK